MNEERQNHEFWEAVLQNQVLAVQNILVGSPHLASKNQTPDSLESNGFPLVQACKNGSLEMVKVLIENGADPNAEPQRNDRLVFGMPLIHACEQSRPDIIEYLLDHGASVNAYPNCDKPFVTRIYDLAVTSGAQGNMVIQSFAFLSTDERNAYRLSDESGVDVNAMLFQKVLDLGGRPPIISMIRNREYVAIELLLRRDPDGTAPPGDWLGKTNFEAAVYGAAWHGDIEAMELCFDVCGSRHTVYAAAFCIHCAIKSHNRDGGFIEYRKIIEMNLNFLKTYGNDLRQLDGFDWFHPLISLSTSFFNSNNYGHRCSTPNTIDNQLELAELFVQHGFDVNQRLDDPTMTPLSAATTYGHERYAEFLRTNGARD